MQSLTQDIFRIISGIAFILSAFIAGPGCQAVSPYHSGDGNNLPDSSPDLSGYTLPLPEVPLVLTTPQERAAFVAAHYWDGMDWNDRRLLGNERFMGESMATYATLLGITPREKGMDCIAELVNSIGTDPLALNTLADYAYSYLYLPESPLYDEELYLMFVNPLLAQPGLLEENHERLDKYKTDILKNRVGNIATDFTFIGTDGQSHDLLSLSPKASLRVLIFYAPGCDKCDEAFEIIKRSEAFSIAEARGEVSVIAINPFGQNNPGPAMIKPGMPKSWIVGYSPEGALDSDETYIIRSTPAIYILDRNGTILQKNLSLDRLKEFLNSPLQTE
ncbi:MAG: DUF5106 domain-containing protein [Muribaculaceae bacterium]|nr:DUF5106 domain-containing protein [Muribaculaceae bacterium]